MCDEHIDEKKKKIQFILQCWSVDSSVLGEHLSAEVQGTVHMVVGKEQGASVFKMLGASVPGSVHPHCYCQTPIFRMSI